MASAIGIDVAKDKIDVASSDGKWCATFKTTARELKRCAKQLKKNHKPERVVVEATGGYERVVLHALHQENLAVVLIQPARARQFARAMGVKAKTDTKDALVLAKMGATLLLEENCWEPPSPSVEELRSLVAHRDHLIQFIGDAQKRLPAASPAVRKSIERTLKVPRQEVKTVEKLIRQLLAKDTSLKERDELLRSVKGVGFVTSIVLLSHMTELGKLNRGEAASLAGLAPFNRDSGTKTGKRHIVGGRARVRKALYMAVMGGRYNPVLRSYNAQLVDRGKAKKAAKIACARKLLIYLNTLMRGYYASQAQGAVS